MPLSYKFINYKIILKEGVILGYYPLYKQSEEELQAAKAYITANLTKGFIVESNTLFILPILIVKKLGSSLRFYVNYRKLNTITKKDRYPIPLIDEIFQRLGKARFFTKLDIRQGFYRIRLYPNSKDLITFRTRYGLFKYKVIPFRLINRPAIF